MSNEQTKPQAQTAPETTALPQGQVPVTSVAAEATVTAPAKRGRGRPKGSKNKPKQA